MGGLFTKPITREDLLTALNTALNTALTPIEKRLQRLEDSLEAVTDSLLAPDGDQVAKDVTVAIYSTGSSSVACHGCIIRREDAVYLLSAAHSIVDLTYGGTYSIRWSMHSEDLFPKVEFDQVYIPEDYVRRGSNDVGIAKITDAHLTPQDGWREFSMNDRELAGKTVVGHGRVFLRGSVLSYPEEQRIMIGTPSMPGCSGCPLFDNRKNLVAFVHGGVKHRGGRVLHTGGTDDATGYLYADSPDLVTFRAVASQSYSFLKIAEDIDSELASRPTDAALYLKLASTGLKKAAPDASTLDEAMVELHRQIWPTNGIDDILSIKLNGRLKIRSRSHAE
jgi:hypothetical protein